jgi:hypothetical protein
MSSGSDAAYQKDSEFVPAAPTYATAVSFQFSKISADGLIINELNL